MAITNIIEKEDLCGRVDCARKRNPSLLTATIVYDKPALECARVRMYTPERDPLLAYLGLVSSVE